MNEDFFSVIVETPACRHCGHGAAYTVVYKVDGSEVGIGKSWGGPADDEAAKNEAEELCDDLNNAVEVSR